MTAQPSPFWHPDVHADRRPRLLARGRIKAEIRRYFEAQGFIEVDTVCLQVSPGNEAHLHAFKTAFRSEAGAEMPLYLHTSPEFAMKKLLAAGETKIFTFTPAFRNAERSPLHSPEFTMLEWYRAGEPYERLWEDCASLLRIAATVTERSIWDWRGRTCGATKGFGHLTLDQAFVELAGIALHETYTAEAVDRDALASRLAATGLRVAPDDTWSDLFSRVIAERIEPRTGLAQPDILHEYPAHEAALARRVADRPRVAERFELYACGVELANGFGELTDAGEQRRRLVAEMDEKQRVYGERYPIDEDFLAALASMPAASGCALGFDRLVMLATGATHIDQVLWTPIANTGTRGP